MSCMEQSVTEASYNKDQAYSACGKTSCRVTRKAADAQGTAYERRLFFVQGQVAVSYE